LPQELDEFEAFLGEEYRKVINLDDL